MNDINNQINNKYKKLFTSWHCPVSNDREINKKEEITFYPNGTYKIRKDNGFGILLETAYIGELGHLNRKHLDSLFKNIFQKKIIT